MGQTVIDSSSNVISPFLNVLTDLCLCSDEDKESGAGNQGGGRERGEELGTGVGLRGARRMTVRVKTILTIIKMILMMILELL